MSRDVANIKRESRGFLGSHLLVFYFCVFCHICCIPHSLSGLCICVPLCPRSWLIQQQAAGIPSPRPPNSSAQCSCNSRTVRHARKWGFRTNPLHKARIPTPPAAHGAPAPTLPRIPSPCVSALRQPRIPGPCRFGKVPAWPLSLRLSRSSPLLEITTPDLPGSSI